MRLRDLAPLAFAAAVCTLAAHAEGLSGGIGGGTAGAYSGHETGDLSGGVGRFRDPPGMGVPGADDLGGFDSDLPRSGALAGEQAPRAVRDAPLPLRGQTRDQSELGGFERPPAIADELPPDPGVQPARDPIRRQPINPNLPHYDRTPP